MEIKVGGPAPSVRNKDHRVFYTNAAKIQVSPWDLKMVFGQLAELDGEVVNDEQVTVIMSPQHAKALLNHWITTIKSYESTFGAIDDPTAKLAELGKQAEAAKAPKGR